MKNNKAIQSFVDIFFPDAIEIFVQSITLSKSAQPNTSTTAIPFPAILFQDDEVVYANKEVLISFKLLNDQSVHVFRRFDASRIIKLTFKNPNTHYKA